MPAEILKKRSAMKNNIKPRQLCFRLLFWIIGQFFIASGIVFSVKSNLGVSAGSSVPYVFSQLKEINNVFFMNYCNP